MARCDNRGRKVSPWNFPEIDSYFGPALYVVELSNGWVKVGHTGAPRLRMMTLRKHVADRYGASIVRYRFARTSFHGRWAAEREAIKALADVAPAVDGTREFFAGITFERAADIALSTPETAKEGA